MAFVRPIMFYGVIVWWRRTHEMSTLGKILNKVQRMLSQCITTQISQLDGRAVQHTPCMGPKTDISEIRYDISAFLRVPMHKEFAGNYIVYKLSRSGTTSRRVSSIYTVSILISAGDIRKFWCQSSFEVW